MAYANPLNLYLSSVELILKKEKEASTSKPWLVLKWDAGRCWGCCLAEYETISELEAKDHLLPAEDFV